MAEAKNKEMRDILGDLQVRANWIRQQIRAEQAQFGVLFAQVRREHDNRLESIRAELEIVTRILQYARWHHELRMWAARALALAATAKIAAREFSQVQSRSVIAISSGSEE